MSLLGDDAVIGVVTSWATCRLCEVPMRVAARVSFAIGGFCNIQAHQLPKTIYSPGLLQSYDPSAHRPRSRLTGPEIRHRTVSFRCAPAGGHGRGISRNDVRPFTVLSVPPPFHSMFHAWLWLQTQTQKPMTVCSSEKKGNGSGTPKQGALRLK